MERLVWAFGEARVLAVRRQAVAAVWEPVAAGWEPVAAVWEPVAVRVLAAV